MTKLMKETSLDPGEHGSAGPGDGEIIVPASTAHGYMGILVHLPSLLMTEGIMGLSMTGNYCFYSAADMVLLVQC